MTDDTGEDDTGEDGAPATAVVTGANGGLGREVTRALAARGTTVVMACRSVERGERAREDVLDDHPDADLGVRELDLGDLDSVASFAGSVREEVDALDVLVNNAGVMAIPRRETADGFERQFGVNHLGHFALTGRLLDRVLAADGRVVTVSSGAHAAGEMDFSDLHAERDYGKWRQYGRSKLANLLFAFELDRRLRAAGEDAVSVAAHPGWAATDLQYAGPRMEGSRVKTAVMRVANALLGQSPERGAAPIVHAATAPDVAGGDYYGPDGLMEMRGDPTLVEAEPKAYDEADARELWRVSADQTGVAFDLPAPDAAGAEDAGETADGGSAAGD
jgi:NAD(P)-dependent dehydrogenase (short-subunit alcohol dehydrogenase family)